MRKFIVLSGAAVLAAISFSNMARAESGPWYNTFQVEACKRMPEQAGCYGFEASAPQAQPVSPVSGKKHSRN